MCSCERCANFICTQKVLPLLVFCHVTKGIQDRRIEWILNEEVGDLVEVSGLIKLFIMNIRQHLIFSY